MVKIPTPPNHLSEKAKALWEKINSGWELDDLALTILEQALTHFDRAEQAKKLIEDEGLIVENRAGTKKENPAVTIERKSRDSMIRTLKVLNLEIEPLHEGRGRPGGT